MPDLLTQAEVHHRIVGEREPVGESNITAD